MFRNGRCGVFIAASVLVTEEKLTQEVVDTIVARGGRALALQADMSKLAEVRRLFQQAGGSWTIYCQARCSFTGEKSENHCRLADALRQGI